MNITAVRAALKVALEGLDRFQIYDYVPDSPNVPCVIVVPDEPFINYHAAMSVASPAQLNFRLTVLVPHADSWAHQAQLDEALSAGSSAARSVFDLVEAKQSDGTMLGGAVPSVQVTAAENYGVRDLPDTRALGADLRITIYLPRT